VVADIASYLYNWLVLLNWFQPIRSPLVPTLLLTGVVPQESSIFKSALNPLRLTFKTANGGTSKIIYKKGDDLRQDQLVSNRCFFTFNSKLLLFQAVHNSLGNGFGACHL
jgi:hypothetical protein